MTKSTNMYHVASNSVTTERWTRVQIKSNDILQSFFIKGFIRCGIWFNIDFSNIVP